MENSFLDGSGNTTVTEGLPVWTKRIIEATVNKHIATCPLGPRVGRLEIRQATLIAFMVGSGICGGMAGALVNLVYNAAHSPGAAALGG